MGYSALFSPDLGNYPVVCIHETILGEPCPSCGLSHAFSLIIRGRPGEALDLNSYSLRVFLFFALQLLLRVGLSFIYLKETNVRTRNGLIATDSVITAIMFLIAFFPLMKFIVWSAGTLF